MSQMVALYAWSVVALASPTSCLSLVSDWATVAFVKTWLFCNASQAFAIAVSLGQPT